MEQTDKFLANMNWKRLADADLSACNDEERAFLRTMEEQGIQGETWQLTEIIVGCTNKFQFAKTYKVLRADLFHTLHAAGAGNPKMPPHVNDAYRRIFLRHSSSRSCNTWPGGSG